MLGGLLAGREAAGQAVPAAVNCAGGRLDGAERVICASPELRRLGDSVDGLTRQLEARLTGDDRAALIATERPFVTERNNCQNEGPEVRDCVERIVRGRGERVLRRTQTDLVLAGDRAAHRGRAGAVGSGAVARMPTPGRGVP